MDLSRLRIERSDEAFTGGGRRGPKRVFWAATLLVLAALTWGLYYFAALTPRSVRVVTVVRISATEASVVLNASGYVVAQRRAAVASKGTGRLVDLAVREGDEVRKGQVIARLESDDVEAALAQARANVNVARSEFNRARAEYNDAALSYERRKSLFEAGLVSEAEFDSAEARYRRAQAAMSSAEAAIRAAEAAMRGAEVGLENTRIRAPFDGTVLTKNAEVGEVVAPFGSSAFAKAAVVTIADMDSLQVEADVSESNIEKVLIGQSCEIILDAYPKVRYRGVVDTIVPTADRAKATVLTKIRFIDRDEKVLPEMSAKVGFLSDPGKQEAEEPKMAVSPGALVERDGRKVAYRLVEDRVQEVSVSVGEPLGRLLEIRSGLAPGDRVVLDPPDDLLDGQSVRVRSEG